MPRGTPISSLAFIVRVSWNKIFPFNMFPSASQKGKKSNSRGKKLLTTSLLLFTTFTKKKKHLQRNHMHFFQLPGFIIISISNKVLLWIKKQFSSKHTNYCGFIIHNLHHTFIVFIWYLLLNLLTYLSWSLENNWNHHMLMV